jgi:3-phosphoshikimate 1-carboxyvinyltransferase
VSDVANADTIAAIATAPGAAGVGVVRVSGPKLQCDRYEVEGDYSSASYWFAAAAATGGSMRVTGLKRESAQGDSRFLPMLESMGCTVTWQGDVVIVNGPSRLNGGTFDCNATPDVVPTLAAIAPIATGPVEIVNVANLRVKESDRLSTVSSELRQLGVRVEERPDSLRIEPGWSDAPATIDSHNDHRIAMAFAIAGLARGNVSIADEQVVSKSYPTFWRTLEAVTAESAGVQRTAD